jgi:flagellar basal-body rod modification protein FlgD
MSPLQPHEFAAQLAQFSSVERLTSIEEAMQLQTQAASLNAIVGQTALSAALIGRVVHARGDQVAVVAGREANVRAEIPVGSGGATLTVKDGSGKVVATRDLGVLAAGTRTIALPGDLAPGTYRITVEVADKDGEKSAVATYTSGVVDGVSFKDGGIRLRMGTLDVALNDVVDVDAATAAP